MAKIEIMISVENILDTTKRSNKATNHDIQINFRICHYSI